MKPSHGSTNRESSPASPATNTYFFPSWVSSVFYGGSWHMVKPGTYKENIETDHGVMVVYEDPFDGEIIFVKEIIKGYRVKKPEPIPEEDPKASVTTLRDWKK